jgi:hypothetical protein
VLLLVLCGVSMKELPTLVREPAILYREDSNEQPKRMDVARIQVFPSFLPCLLMGGRPMAGLRFLGGNILYDIESDICT